ncbi:oxidoreductase [Candidatus Peregrinibacteria bacterium]|nr:oxidoreductase [Candidatus Peregrinibacteria bacterium]
MRKLVYLPIFVLLIAGCSQPNATNDNTQNNNVKIKNTFSEKIVYGQENAIEDMINDCEKRNGIFENCGSGCPKSAEVCATVCVPICELSDQNKENNNDNPDENNENNGDDSNENNEKNLGTDNTQIGLNLPKNFTISEFATNVDGARVLVGPDKLGNLWLSRTSEGIISNIQLSEEGEVENISDIFTGLNEPHGLALAPSNRLTLYFAESDKVSKVELYTDASTQKLVDLPDGGKHFTRTLHFGPDNKLYVSIGSNCDTCVEEDERRAAVYVMNKDGSNFKKFADGLRNSVFLATDPIYGEIWATEMGRDHLGDNLPPDEVNILKEGENYGWPYCYGEKIRDEEFMPEENFDCNSTVPSKVNLQAHSAPLGLAFVPEEGWPEEMALDLLIAYHGSWNRSEPTGYKIMRIKLDDQRKVTGRENFISGWLKENEDKLGRPVDLLIMPGGILYITDDKKGVIYKVTYGNE